MGEMNSHQSFFSNLRADNGTVEEADDTQVPMYSSTNSKGSTTSDISKPHNLQDNNSSIEPSSNSQQSILPVISGWAYRRFRRQDAAPFLEHMGLQNILSLSNETQSTQHEILSTHPIQSNKRKGWQGPGPGPKKGKRQANRLRNWFSLFEIALLHLIKEALHHEQVYYLSNVTTRSNEVIATSERLYILGRLESEVLSHHSAKRKVWNLSSQIGTPGFVMKVTSAPHAIALYLLPNRPGSQWWCTYCIDHEVQLVSECQHTHAVKQIIEQIATKLNLATYSLNAVLMNSAAFKFIPELSSACFYGDAKKKGINVDIAVVSNPSRDLSEPIDDTNRIHIVRRTRNGSAWRCTAMSCTGLGMQSTQACEHVKIVTNLAKAGMNTPFSSLAMLQYPHHVANIEIAEDGIKRPRHARRMIPSEQAFAMDKKIQSDYLAGTTSTIQAAKQCFCGIHLEGNEAHTLQTIPLRVETARSHVNYLQQVWTCTNGHDVLPEEDPDSRDGLLWISKSTAYSEVFLFDILLHIVFGGTTISSQADIRSQMFFLQQNYDSQRETPRSSQSVRRAVISYAMSVVMGMEDWIFRCDKCSIRTEEGEIYYDKLSFDGQQLGFRLTHDTRYDFYGKKSFTWRRPVERSKKAWKSIHLIESHNLRTILTEVCRVRKIPQGCTSVHALCRSMMKIPLNTREAIRAAMAAIRMLDPTWRMFVNQDTPFPDDSDFESFRSTFKEDQTCHPLTFITSNTTEHSFLRAMAYIRLFKNVLDARMAAAAISILLVSLRSDLREHIPPQDKAFLQSYSPNSRVILNHWLLQLSQSEGWDSLPLPSPDVLYDGTGTGIANHSPILVHPYRPTWSWNYVESTSTFSHPNNVQQMLCKIRNVGPWICPKPATTRILLMVMAIFNEPTSVWLRDGSFEELLAAVEILRKAEQYCGTTSYAHHCRAAFTKLKNSVLLYEGVIGIIGADDSDAKTLYATLREVISTVPQKYEEYASVLHEEVPHPTGSFSPKQFDDMLVWTSACTPNETRRPEDAVTSTFIKQKYRNISSMQSTDFLETGIWGPDFPQRRPSPNSAIWGSDTAQAERSCSKNFDVHSSFSPGTFGGYCLCKHMKNVSLIFLKQPEGCRMPLNFIIERCPKLPRYVVYDFACGTQKAAIGMSSRLIEHTSFVIDPFHFPGHKTCSLGMHPSSYGDLRGLNTESQEQRNKSIKLLDRTLRASRDTHFMHLVILTHGYLNLKAIFRDHNDSEPMQSDIHAWLKWIQENKFQEA